MVHGIVALLLVVAFIVFCFFFTLPIFIYGGVGRVSN